MGIKVLTITEPENIFVEELLCRNVYNDYLFEKTFFTIRISTDDMSGLLYRKLWETIYLRADRFSRVVVCGSADKNIIDLKISLSEALSFIKQATPPNLTKLINDSTQSIHDIREVLEEFLINDKSVICDYRDRFKNHIHFREFETTWNENTDKVDYLSDINKSNIDCSLITSNTPMADLADIKYEITHDIEAQVMFRCINNAELVSTLFRDYLRENYKIINMKIINNKIYIMAYLDININDEFEIKHFKAMMRLSYSKILKS